VMLAAGEAMANNIEKLVSLGSQTTRLLIN